MTMNTRVQTHYSLICVLLSIYGISVCPFIDSLRLAQLVTPILFTFSVMYVTRLLLRGWLSSRESHYQVKIQFKTDVMLFVIGGLALATFNYLQYDFPAGSGLKIVLGMSVSGFLVACDLGLRRENSLARELSHSGQNIEINHNPYPLTKKFSWFASICVLIMGAIISLVIAKDLAWIVKLDENQNLLIAAIQVFLEVLFVLIIMLGYILVIISAYGTNMQLLLGFQQSTLAQVANGELTNRVPIVSNDELGVIASHTNHAIQTLQTRTEELGQLRDITILALASLAETRDNETGAHLRRTQQYVRVLAEQLKDHDRFKSVLDSSMIDLLYKTAPLHDAGKVGIPDAILLKPGPLSDEEFSIMKQHPLIGVEALRSAQAELGENSFLSVASEIMKTHHEKWDGSGYPDGLKGEEIPISGRLMALADVYDALTSERVYKAAFSHEKARDIIVDGKGKHFDPDVVDAFLKLEDRFQQIAIQFSKPATVLTTAA